MQAWLASQISLHDTSINHDDRQAFATWGAIMIPDAEYNRLAVISPERLFHTSCRRVFLLILCGVLLISSCNFPGIKNNLKEPSMSDIRQTLQAIALTTPTAPSNEYPSEIGLTPIPTLGTPPVLEVSPFLPESTWESNPEVYTYITRSGDTLDALSKRFEIDARLIQSSAQLPQWGLLTDGLELHIPNTIGQDLDPQSALPDCELVNSPSSLDFDISAFISAQGGYLSRYTEVVQKVRLSGAQIIERVAIESSINPRLLLALLEQRSGLVRSLAGSQTSTIYPLGFHIVEWSGLYKELVMASTHLNAGYYGWRVGALNQIKFSDGKVMRLDPGLNAGTVALKNMYSKLVGRSQWQESIYGPGGLIDTYQQLFGDPWERCYRIGSLLPAGLQQPFLELPFLPGLRWSLTGGPHASWKTGSPRGALDFAPVTGEKACSVSAAWVTAPANGLVVRSDRNVVAIDLDKDGYEQTGWVIVFLHIADHERVQAGTTLKTDEKIGHPSCEGGNATGTHFHIARKQNGEWIAADWPLPFMMGGWQVFAGGREYLGGMFNGEQEIVASPVGPRTSIIMR